MGQRLVINIREGEDIKCNAYYHWSGYTNSAIAIIKEMKLDEFEELATHSRDFSHELVATYVNTKT